MSEAAQLTQISDNVNQGYIAGRDLYLGDQYVVQETLYFEPDLEDVEPAAWTTTPKARELAAALLKHRLIVLAGQELDNKTMVARHLAWLLRQELAGEVLVREWYRSSDPQKIETAFHPTAKTILLLPQVQPHHVGHRLSELVRLLRTRGNYLVITTEETREEWGVRGGSSEDTLWHEITWETYYGRVFLADLLLEELAGGRLPEGLPHGALQAGSLLAHELTVEAVAVRLRQPDRIRRFAEWLSGQETAKAPEILAQLDQLGGDRAAVFRWYRQLDHNDQLLALGLVLFDGLPDDQAFAGVEYLVSEAWRRTDPNLPLFDYKALGRLGAFFHLSEAGQDGARIETPSRQKREAMLRAAWELQRRRLLSVVPALTQLLKRLSPNGKTAPAAASTAPTTSTASAVPGQPATDWRAQLVQVGAAVAKSRLSRFRYPFLKRSDAKEDPESWRFTQGHERELSSTPRRAEQLQRSVIESLSQIGLLSFEAVEAAFLELAAEGSTGVQTAVAKALASWRGEGCDEKVFRVLQDWWAAGCRTTLPKALAKRKVAGADPLAGIRATVALAIGYALQYDPPNQLAGELLGLLEKALADAHPTVRQRVLELTLPLAAASHPEQLENLLRSRLVADQEQMYAIAFGVAMAYSLRPLEALRTLDCWSLMVHSQGVRPPDDLTILPRDRLLATVALIYGHVRCEQNQELLTPEKAISELRSILTTESHPFVRTHALMAMGLQAVHNFKLAASMLIDLISEIALSDRANVVSIFSRAYLNQREELTGGDGEIEIGGRSYQIWLRGPRPLTPIEVSLYAWLRDESHSVARQVAVQAFTAFASTELERQEREVMALQPQAEARKRRRFLLRMGWPVWLVRLVRRLRRPRKARRLRRLSPLAHLAVFFAAPFQRPIRPLVRPVLAEVIEVERTDRRKAPRTSLAAPGSSAPMIIEKWRSTSDENMRSLARSLRVALRLFRWRWVILLTAVLAGILWQNWREWQWSHADPLPPAETLQIQMQNALPQRLIWQKWVPRFQQYEADRLAALEEAVLKAAGKQAELLTAAEKPAPDPVNRLRKVAELSLTRLSRAQDKDFQEKVREAYRAEREALKLATLQKDSRLKAVELIAFLRALPSIGMRTPEQIKAEELAGRVIFERLQKARGWPTAQSRMVETEEEDAPAETASQLDEMPVEIPDGGFPLPESLPETTAPPGAPSWLNKVLKYKGRLPPPPSLPGGNHGHR